MKILKYLFVLLFLLVFFALTSYFVFRDQLAHYAASKVSKIASQKKLIMNYKDPEIGLVNFKASNLDLKYYYKFFPLMLTVSDLKLSPLLLSALNNNKQSDFSFKTLDGHVVGSLGFAPETQVLTLPVVDLSGVNLAQHSQLQALGLDSGILNLRARDLNIHGRKLAVNHLEIDLKDLLKDDETVLPNWLTGLPITLKLPAINVDSLQTELALNDFNLDIKSLELLSNWLNLSLTGQFRLDLKTAIKNLEGSVQLGESGHKLIKDYLPILSNQQLTSESKKFNFKFKKYMGPMPIFDFS